MKMKAFLLSIFVPGLMLPALALAAPQTDFDGDGISDLTGVKIQPDGTLKFSIISSTTRRAVDLGTFGVNGNHIAAAHWQAGNTPQLAVISKSNSGTISWKLQGATSGIDFGSGEDIVVGGGDFDNTGLADGAIISKVNGELVWRFNLDMFASGSSGSNIAGPFTYGISSDIPFFVSPDGGVDWVAVLRKNQSNATIFMKNLMTSEERSFNISSSLAKYGRPVPLKDRDGKDLLVFSKVSGSKTAVTVFTTAGRRVRRTNLTGNGDLVVGDFNAATAGEEIAIRSRSSFAVYNPRSNKTVTRRGRISIAIDEVNINTFGSGAMNPPGIDGCSELDPTDGGGGFVWKPNSDTTYYAVAVMPGSLRGKISKVETYTSSGSLIKQLTLTGCGNPDQNGPRCNYKDFSLTGRDYKNRYGALVLKVSLSAGGCGSYYIADPSRRSD